MLTRYSLDLYIFYHSVEVLTKKNEDENRQRHKDKQVSIKRFNIIHA